MIAELCLSLALYHEARGEPLNGQRAVAEVIMNRVESNRFPDTICGVVMQPNQFSFVYFHGRNISLTCSGLVTLLESKKCVPVVIAGNISSALTGATLRAS